MIAPDEFKTEVVRMAKEMKTEAKEIHIRPMKNKWASCSSGGRLTFDTKLLSESEEFRREVISHELLHLTVQNHGKLFKVLHESYANPKSCKSMTR